MSGTRKQKVKLHSFRIGDVDDIEVCASYPIYEWQQTDIGKWATENAEDIHWISVLDPGYYSWEIQIIGTLSEKNLLLWRLKSG